MIQFIKATSTDLDYIITITRQAKIRSEEQGVFQWNENYPSVELLRKDLDADETYILFNNQQRIGFIVLNGVVEHGGVEYVQWKTTGKFLFIHRLCIDPSLQAKGLGTAVVKAVEADFADEDINSLRLDVFSTNAQAIHIYEKLGFIRLGQAPCDRGTFYIYEKPLK